MPAKVTFVVCLVAVFIAQVVISGSGVGARIQDPVVMASKASPTPVVTPSPTTASTSQPPLTKYPPVIISADKWTTIQLLDEKVKSAALEIELSVPAKLRAQLSDAQTAREKYWKEIVKVPLEDLANYEPSAGVNPGEVILKRKPVEAEKAEKAEKAEPVKDKKP